MRTRIAVRFVCGLLLAGGWSSASAQEPQRDRRVEVLGLELTSLVSTGDVAGETTFSGRASLPDIESRYHTDVNAAVRYQPLAGERMNYGLNLQSAVRRYESADEFMVLGHSVGGHVTVNPASRLSFVTFASGSYLPTWGLNLAPTGTALRTSFAATAPGDLPSAATSAGLLPASAVDYSLTKRTSFSVVGGGAMRYSIGRRLELQLSYSQQRDAFRLENDPDLRTEEAGGRLTYRLSRYLGFRAGFSRRFADYVVGDQVQTTVFDDIDVGLESGYGRQLNLSRSTTLSFDTGSTLTHRNGQHAAQLTGSASLAQRLGRRGQTSIAFSRGAELRAGFHEPLFTNNVNAVLQVGFLKNLEFNASAAGSVGHSLGQTAVSLSDHVRSYQASARLSYRFLGRGQVFGQYLVAGHDIGSAVGLFDGVARNQEGRSVRGGLTWSFTLASQRPPARRAASAQGDN